MTQIIAPIARHLLKQELTEERFVRTTNKADNEIYIVNGHNSPNLLQEIGRLREVSFAAAGGGTGLSVDLDEYDTHENCYEQLIVWSPEDEEIVGGYRFIDCSLIYHLNPIPLSTHHYFDYAEKFIRDYMPFTVELGRSWVQPNFQPQINPRKGIFSLDNLWDGLGAIVVKNPHIKHFFGKVTMYTNYNQEARDAVLAFMHHYFPDTEKLVTPKKQLGYFSDVNPFLTQLIDLNFKDGLRVLGNFVKDRGELIPPLINSYMQLSPTMKTFGTAMNSDFGDVEETGILVTIADIFPEKRERHVDTFVPGRSRDEEE